MRNADHIGLGQFLTDYPRMAIRPASGVHLRLKGRFSFAANHPAHGHLSDAFDLLIDVPAAFPRELPMVKEVGGRIPRRAEYHINGDGSLCLGSHLRLLQKLAGAPTLSGFTDRCLIPYLYAISKKLAEGGKLIFGELAHYGPGMLQDYAQLFGLPSADQALFALELLGMRKRVANKRPCPCGCRQRLGRCGFRRRLLGLRRLASRGWFRRQLLLAQT